MKLKIPPPVYLLSVMLVMWLLSRHLPIATLIAPPITYVGLFIIAVAALMDFSSLYLFFKKRTTPNPMKPEFTTGLVTEGLYKFSRNPMYLGMLIILFGIAIYLGKLTPFLMLPVFYFVITEMQIKPEEDILEEKFGKEYIDYKRKVRRWI